MDEFYMKRALELAYQGRFYASPNPMVGCLVVDNEKIICEGLHKKFGDSHAEKFCLDCAGLNFKGATLYVNLVPCCNHGKTPPCTDVIISSGIDRVVYASDDPSQSRSVEILQNAGIEVVGCVLKREADLLNRKFLHWAKTGKPYVTLKAAVTLDGQIATRSGESQYITSDDARSYVHELRAQHDAVLIGRGTLEKDNPNLGLHKVNGNEPHRIVMSSKLEKRSNLQFFRDENCSVVSTVEELWNLAEKLNTSSIFVEGGSEIFTSFINDDLYQELIYFVSFKAIGSNHLPVWGDLNIDTLSKSKNFTLVEHKVFENCLGMNLIKS